MGYGFEVLFSMDGGSSVREGGGRSCEGDRR